MGGASKILTLITTPLPLLYPRRPAPFLRLARLSSLSSVAYLRRRRLLSRPYLAVSSSNQQFHTQTHSISRDTSFDDGFSPSRSVITGPHAWPEWSRLVDHLATSGFTNRSDISGRDDDCIVGREELPEEFVKISEALILFAREKPDLLRSMSKKDIEIIVENGSPFLFRNGEDSARRLRSYISGNDNNSIQYEPAETVDIVQYLLSYACDSNNSGADEAVDACVKNLLVELVNLSGRTSRVPDFVEPYQRQSLLQRNIEMKRGDWICPKCSFMNFARNTKCLECSELRPKRVLTGEEWECPQCDFFNYGRNVSCLRCDCKRPGKIPIPSSPNPNPNRSSSSTLGEILNKSTIEKSEMERRLERRLANSQYSPNLIGSKPDSPAESESPWESLVNQRQDPGYLPFNPLPPDMFGKSKDSTEPEMKSEPSDLPEIMPMRKGENKFVISKRKDRSLTSPQYKRRIAMEQANNNNNSSNFVPFVPLPPDYFAKMRESKSSGAGPAAQNFEQINTNANYPAQQNNIPRYNSGSSYNSDIRSSSLGANLEPSRETWNNGHSYNSTQNNSGGPCPEPSRESWNNNTSPNGPHFNQPEPSRESWKNGYSANPEPSRESWNNGYSVNAEPSRESWNSGYSSQTEASRGSWKSLEGSAVREPDPLDMSEEAKAERWFRRAAQIKDISELANIPDEDFPEIMPMRKGVNRFVVSKRKTPLERRLTSTQYRRNLPIISSDPDKDSN